MALVNNFSLAVRQSPNSSIAPCDLMSRSLYLYQADVRLTAASPFPGGAETEDAPDGEPLPSIHQFTIVQQRALKS